MKHAGLRRDNLNGMSFYTSKINISSIYSQPQIILATFLDIFNICGSWYSLQCNKFANQPAELRVNHNRFRLIWNHKDQPDVMWFCKVIKKSYECKMGLNFCVGWKEQTIEANIKKNCVLQKNGVCTMVQLKWVTICFIFFFLYEKQLIQANHIRQWHEPENSNEKKARFKFLISKWYTTLVNVKWCIVCFQIVHLKA